jgi:hypothetical protein
MNITGFCIQENDHAYEVRMTVTAYENFFPNNKSEVIVASPVLLTQEY